MRSTLDEDEVERIRLATVAGGDLDVELRVGVERHAVALHRAGVRPARYTTGLGQVQARVRATGAGTGFIADQFHGGALPDLLDRVLARELPALCELARVLAGPPQPWRDAGEVLLDGRVAARLLALAVPAFGLDAVLEGRSPLAGRTGQRVGAAGVELVDDPRAADSPLRPPWDDEGTPTGRTVLLRDGVLAGLLSDRRRAAQAGTVSTAAGWRGAGGQMATVHPGHLWLDTGDRRDPRQAGGPVLTVVAANGAHTANNITGDFSIGANAVLCSSGGEVRNAGAITVAGNVFDLLAGVCAGDGAVRTYRTDAGFISTPGLWTDRLTIGR